jgi:hypothetical protein
MCRGQKQTQVPICATSVIFIKLPKENNRPIGENSPNLVTLTTTSVESRRMEICSCKCSLIVGKL